MNKNFVQPNLKSKSFTCPHCGVYANMDWVVLKVWGTRELIGKHYCYASICSACGEENIWITDEDELCQMVYPKQTIISPTEDMPEHIKRIYKEASLIFGDSPRASCALLRLALQELMIYFRDNFEEYSSLKGENINNDIKTLVGLGLSPKIQKALDIVRITGNSAVHPNKLDVNDNLDIAESLFRLLNLIVEEMITKPKEIDEIFRRMPEREKESVKKRDSEK